MNQHNAARPRVMTAWRKAACSSVVAAAGMGSCMGSNKRAGGRERNFIGHPERSEGSGQASQIPRCARDASVASVPPDRLLVQVDEHLLRLQVLLHPPVPQLPTEAAHLVTTPRRLD